MSGKEVYNIFFFPSDNKLYPYIREHLEWIKNVNFKFETQAAIRILKSWRRSREINCLKSEIIESLTYKLTQTTVGGTIMKVLDNIIFSCLEHFKPGVEKYYDKPYQIEFLKNLSYKEIQMIQKEAAHALQMIKEEKFAEMF